MPLDHEPVSVLYERRGHKNLRMKAESDTGQERAFRRMTGLKAWEFQLVSASEVQIADSPTVTRALQRGLSPRPHPVQRQHPGGPSTRQVLSSSWSSY